MDANYIERIAKKIFKKKEVIRVKISVNTKDGESSVDFYKSD